MKQFTLWTMIGRATRKPRNEDFKDAENQSQPGLDKNQHASQQTSSRPVSRDSSGRDIETTAPSSVPTADTTQASHDTSARQADPHRSSDASIEEDRSQPEVRPPRMARRKMRWVAEQGGRTGDRDESEVVLQGRTSSAHRAHTPSICAKASHASNRIEEIDRKRARCRNPLRREWEQLHQTDSREALDEILRAFHTDLAGQNGSASAAQGDKAPASDAKKRALGDTLEDAEEVAIIQQNVGRWASTARRVTDHCAPQIQQLDQIGACWYVCART